jgi:hypothetical protein
MDGARGSGLSALLFCRTAEFGRYDSGFSFIFILQLRAYTLPSGVEGWRGGKGKGKARG